MEVQIINKVAKYFDVKLGKVTLNGNQAPTATIDGKQYTGLATVLIKLFSKNNQWSSKEEECLVYQWLEFISLYISQANSNDGRSILKDLNSYLSNCSYMVGYCKSLADVVLYYSVCDLIASLNASEKQSYIHLCRWFNHIQFDDKIRQENKVINFSSNYTASRIKVEQ